MDEGLAPYAGGVLDQPLGLMEAFEAVWSDQAEMEREMARSSGTG